MSDSLDLEQQTSQSRASLGLDNSDAEIAEMQRQLAEMQEDLQLHNVNDAAKREEGQRKSGLVAPGGAAAAAPTRNTSIFIGNMDPKTTESDLRIFFAPCGPIRRVTMLKDKFTGMPKGNAYVEFEAEDGANAAVLKNNQPCHGKPLKIDMKRDNLPASMRGGAGGAPGAVGQGMPFRGAMPFAPRGRGAAAQMQQQQMAMAAAMMMMGGGAFSPYGAPRGRGRGRGRPY